MFCLQWNLSNLFVFFGRVRHHLSLEHCSEVRLEVSVYTFLGVMLQPMSPIRSYVPAEEQIR